MSKLDILKKAVMDGDVDAAVDAVAPAVEEGTPLELIIDALTDGMREIGDQFARFEIFVPEMVKAAWAMKGVMKALKPELEKQAISTQKKGIIVMATVEGDMHEIGKDIAGSMLEMVGFEVHDLGANVNGLDIIRTAENLNADIIGLSALMTTTMPQQADLIELLKSKGIRDEFHVILGGAPVTQEWVKDADADSWGENATVAVNVLEAVMERSK
jgi:trimethylamine corrinoid protein